MVVLCCIVLWIEGREGAKCRWEGQVVFVVLLEGKKACLEVEGGLSYIDSRRIPQAKNSEIRWFVCLKFASTEFICPRLDSI